MPKSEGSGIRKPRVLSVDFTGVEGRKGARRVPEGDYLFTIKDWGVGGEGDKQWLRIEYTIDKGPTDGDFSDIFGLGKKSLWRLRLFLEAVGFKKLQSSINKIPLDKLPGKKVAGTVGDDEYEGKIRSKVSDYFSAKDYENLGAAEAEDEEADADDEDEDESADLTSGDDDEDDDELEVVDDDDI
ncbi:MAG TPA: hypothetical protein VFK94_03720 [Patescibacteria group bacterium]|nr:hypothetical protein [Patescibacteria group bacterium]